MKRFCIILAFLCVSSAFAQKNGRDYRALLYIRGRVTEISVSPDGRIWLPTYLGKLYYTNGPDSLWHQKSPYKSMKKDDYLGLYMPDFNRINFFNKDTAILTGYIHNDTTLARHGGYYRTTDGGRTWDLLDFGGDAWIYTTASDKEGHVWMGTKGKTIYYSDDFGQHFIPLKISEMKADRIYAMWMQDARHGVIGTSSNEVLLTDDNWRTARKIPTPLDQGKVAIRDEWFDNDCPDKVMFWNGYILLKQLGKTFFTREDTVDWQLLPNKVYDFAIDERSGRLWAVGHNRHLFVFDSPSLFRLFSEDSLPEFYPINLKVVEGKAYMVMSDNTVYLADSSGLRCVYSYTKGPIERPYLTKNGKKLSCGVEKKHLYIKEKKSRHWYRETVLPFDVEDISLLDDSTFVLWDGRENHLYSLRTHTVERYMPNEPIRDFLSAPITKFVIDAGTRGCYHFYATSIIYQTTPNDSAFEASVVTKSKGWEGCSDSVITGYLVGKPLLSNILNEINAHYTKVPDIVDFRITETDKRRYLDQVDTILQCEKYSYRKRFPNSAEELYRSVPGRLGEIDTLALREILNMDEGIESTTSCWFGVTLINENLDTLHLESNFYSTPSPWYLPWKVDYKGLHFNCYCLDFSRYIYRCLTDDFFGCDAFDNVGLLMKIGDYYRFLINED
jgi:hypothetical protein